MENKSNQEEMNQEEMNQEELYSFEETVDFVKQWFYTDLDIEFDIEHEGYSGEFTLESDASYYKGKRFNGKHRRFVMVSGDDELYDEMGTEWMDGDFWSGAGFFGKLYDIEEVVTLLDRLYADYDYVKLL